ncbi:phosphoribosyltransferase [Providencia rustigianii]|uniref:Phosphoribosyltransferase domain-containing protein n=1 Tax=Providencia rustigianii DSM 4541 TaxID=500637 RepID=D1P6E5_9GAMM|nr:phosphoribosyltransferase [Providencia rustigianii]EFB70987.1 hypothetical protein PROVRUST_07867 [Providencia rustigianii DSM 4541]SUC25748.1 Uncharacterised protein [Providencia rustigianii]
MGFVVDERNKLVEVDHSHNHFCITTAIGNPTTTLLDNNLKVTSIFARTKSRRNKHVRKPIGDNNPMLYALKGLHQVRATRRSIIDLNQSYRQILPKFLAAGFVWDWLIPLPSSSNLTALFAKKVIKHSGIGEYHHDIIIKNSAQHTLDSLYNLPIRSSERSALHEDTKRFISFNSPKTPFEIKSITRVKLRKYINPLTWGNIPSNISVPCNILLVDDMVTTGTSLMAAFKLLKQRYPIVNIEALTLFGSSKK